jgi:hypothetical protein
MTIETTPIPHAITLLALCLCAPSWGCGDDGKDDAQSDSSSTTAPGSSDSSSSTSKSTTTAAADSTTMPADSQESGSSSESGGAPLVDACLGEADQAILARIDIEMIANGCGTSNVGDVEGAVACVEEQSGISSDCASCFGLTIGCVFDQCLPACFDATSVECLDCRTTNCDPPFLECSGL